MRRYPFAWLVLTLSTFSLGACGDNTTAEDDEDDAGRSGSGGSGVESGGTGGSGGATGGTGGKGGSTGGAAAGRGGAAGKGGATTTGGTGGTGGAAAGRGGTGGNAAGTGGSTGGSGGTVNNVPACEATQANLVDCGLLPAPVDCTYAADDLATACVLACYSAATCDALTSTLCVGSLETPFADCVIACGSVQLTCDDGVTTYQASFECDGFSDCPGGEDEALCGQFDCQNGEVVADTLTCNMVDDCSNGADEADCATLSCPMVPGATCEEAAAQLASCGLLEGETMTGCLDDVPFQACSLLCLVNASCADLTALYCADTVSAGLTACATTCSETAANAFFCGNGTTVPSSYQCDAEDDCANAADEAGCSSLCADGTTQVTYLQLCDTVAQCPGGEDEVDCAPVCVVEGN